MHNFRESSGKGQVKVWGIGLVKILHLINDLDRGGAEYCLKRLVGSMDAGRFSSHIVSILPLGPLGCELKAEGNHVDTLNCSTLADVPRALWRLIRFVRSKRPDIIQTWLYHADLIGTLASLSHPDSMLLWNVRNAGLEAEKRFSWRVLTVLLAGMSKLPHSIVSNSVAGIESHAKLGYRPHGWAHIPNGWDASDQVPTPEQRQGQRALFGLPKSDTLIGWVGRFAMQKDPTTFLSAVSLLHNRYPNLRFVLAGKDLAPSTQPFRDAMQNVGFRDRLIFLGEVGNVDALLPALDAMTLTSAYGEGLPNSIGEAMAAGLPVIATDVGDVRRLSVDGNWIIPPKCPEALVEAWIAFANLDSSSRATIGERNRNWIRTHYSIEQMSSYYEGLYAKLWDSTPIRRSEVPDGELAS